MKLSKLLEQMKVKVPDRKIEPNRGNNLSHGIALGYNECLDDLLNLDVNWEGLEPLDESQLSMDLGKFNIEYNGKSPHFQWCNFMAKKICAKFGSSKKEVKNEK